MEINSRIYNTKKYAKTFVVWNQIIFTCFQENYISGKLLKVIDGFWYFS